MVCLLAKALGFRIKFRVLIKYWADCLGFWTSWVWVWLCIRFGCGSILGKVLGFKLGLRCWALIRFGLMVCVLHMAIIQVLVCCHAVVLERVFIIGIEYILG